MTDALSRTGHPYLETASHVAPYRTVLAPPPELGIEWRRVGTVVAAALRASSASAPEGAAVVRTGDEHTVFARCRLLEGGEVGADHPVTDRSSRPIVVTEAVLFAGRVTGDAEAVLRAAQSQFARAIRDYWDDSAAFGTPRFSESVACDLAPAAVAGGPAAEESEPAASTPGTGTDPGADERARPAAAAPATPATLATDAAPPADAPVRRNLLPAVLAVLALLGLAAVVVVAVVLAR